MQSDPPQPIFGVHVLVVDDDDHVRETLGLILESYGAAVTTAASARDALSLVQRARPHVLLSDIKMPEQDGYWLISAVRALAPTLPALAISGSVSEGARQRALAAGFQAFLSKPVQAQVLCDAVKRAVSAAA